jgi:hypothetical protein
VRAAAARRLQVSVEEALIIIIIIIITSSWEVAGRKLQDYRRSLLSHQVHQKLRLHILRLRLLSQEEELQLEAKVNSLIMIHLLQQTTTVINSIEEWICK